MLALTVLLLPSLLDIGVLLDLQMSAVWLQASKPRSRGRRSQTGEFIMSKVPLNPPPPCLGPCGGPSGYTSDELGRGSRWLTEPEVG